MCNVPFSFIFCFCFFSFEIYFSACIFFAGRLYERHKGLTNTRSKKTKKHFKKSDQKRYKSSHQNASSSTIYSQVKMRTYTTQTKARFSVKSRSRNGERENHRF
ncbi:hypothetical protein NQD34_013964 [Periophthalmus magnuspinnatus]|nr:hypothetical protein NQD34_013964 [Periophthalmus magnuspinnatus]